eukprot:1529109-Rhodomonas_salina.1
MTGCEVHVKIAAAVHCVNTTKDATDAQSAKGKGSVSTDETKQCAKNAEGQPCAPIIASSTFAESAKVAQCAVMEELGPFVRTATGLQSVCTVESDTNAKSARRPVKKAKKTLSYCFNWHMVNKNT